VSRLPHWTFGPLLNPSDRELDATARFQVSGLLSYLGGIVSALIIVGGCPTMRSSQTYFSWWQVKTAACVTKVDCYSCYTYLSQPANSEAFIFCSFWESGFTSMPMLMINRLFIRFRGSNPCRTTNSVFGWPFYNGSSLTGTRRKASVSLEFEPFVVMVSHSKGVSCQAW